MSKTYLEEFYKIDKEDFIDNALWNYEEWCKKGTEFGFKTQDLITNKDYGKASAYLIKSELIQRLIRVSYELEDSYNSILEDDEAMEILIWSKKFVHTVYNLLQTWIVPDVNLILSNTNFNKINIDNLPSMINSDLKDFITWAIWNGCDQKSIQRFINSKREKNFLNNKKTNGHLYFLNKGLRGCITYLSFLEKAIIPFYENKHYDPLLAQKKLELKKQMEESLEKEKQQKELKKTIKENNLQSLEIEDSKINKNLAIKNNKNKFKSKKDEISKSVHSENVSLNIFANAFANKRK